MKMFFKQIIFALATSGVLVFITPALAAAETLSLQEAVSKTIEVNAGIKIQAAAVDQRAGDVQAAQGEFDWYLYGTLSRERQNSALPEDQQVILPGQTIDETEETATVYGVGATKKFRNGIVVKPSLSSIDYENNIDQQDPISQSDVVLEFLIPLLKGAGAAYTQASERAAQKNLAATQALSIYNISSRIFNTTSAYWNCLAARHRNDILFDTQQRTEEIFQMVEKLVTVGELEPAILSQASAERFSRSADLAEGQRALKASQLQLSATIGLPTAAPDPLPLAQGEFPMAVDGQLFSGATAGYIDTCLELRGDYLAAKQNVESAKILLEKAQNETRPQLDFTLKTGYGGLDERLNNSRYYGALYNNVPGLNAYAGIQVALPIHNNTARGNVRTRRASLKESELLAEDLGISLASEVRVTLTNLKAALEQVQLARDSAAAYRLALDHIKRKVKGGEASLTELIDMEDRYLIARLSEIAALGKYAVAIAELRLVTGSLLTRESDHLLFKVNDLMTPPLPDDHGN